MPFTTSRTMPGKSRCARVVISPATMTKPVLVSVSQATRLVLSSAMHASSTASETWSHSLSGWPSVTLSEVNKYSDMPSSPLLRRGAESPSSRERRQWRLRYFQLVSPQAAQAYLPLALHTHPVSPSLCKHNCRAQAKVHAPPFLTVLSQVGICSAVAVLVGR